MGVNPIVHQDDTETPSPNQLGEVPKLFDF